LTSDPTDPSRELAFLIDRRNDYWYVPGLHFPPPGPDITAFHTSTLIDGELVLDAQPPGSPVPYIAKYLVFDCLALDNQLLMQRTLDKRIAYFKERVYAPYKALYKAYPEEAAYLPFRVELKEMQFGYAAELMFRNVLPNLPHGSDGLIFTARSTEYKTGTDQNILKWKREEENSVDFEWVFDWETKETAEGERLVDFDALPVISLFVWMGDGKASKWYGTLHLEPQEWADLKALGEPLDERIVECYMDAQKRWRFMRFRDDKDHANHVSTVESVIESIRDAVSEKELIAVAPEVRRRWKAREQVEKERQGRK
jgi:mRNA guanylyltransferase